MPNDIRQAAACRQQSIGGRVCRDDGSVTVFVAAMLGVVMLIFAFVVDIHGQFQALSRADALAADGARAALTAVDTRNMTVSVDGNAAVAAARAYLTRAGYPGTVTVTGDRSVQVTVTVDEPAVIGLLGGRYHAVGTATAQLQVGTRATLTGAGND